MTKYTEVEEKVDAGFDRGVNYIEMKNKLIEKYISLTDDLAKLDSGSKDYDSKKRIINNKIIYCVVSCIQIRNGCRILEACKAIKLFFKNNNLDNKILVKLAKSECAKKKKNGKTFVTKARFRKIIFPTKWIDFEITPEIKEYLDAIPVINLKQRVLDFLLKYFDCNTHSLRYAFINYMLYDKKVEMTLIAKFVGHVDVSQLVRYSQNKNADKIFELD